MNNTKKMKDSGIAWLGEIPQGWETKRVKYLTQKVKGKNPKKIEALDKDGFFPYVTASSFENYRYESFVSSEENLPIVNKDDSIILWDGARAGFIDSGHYGFLSSTMISLKINNAFNKRYFYYFLKSNQKLFQDFANGTTIPHADGELLDNLQIPLPPLETQTRIANYLDKKTSQIGKFIADKKKMIGLLKEQKQAIIHQATTKGIDKNVKMKDSGIAWLGEIPQGWEVRRLKYFSNIKRGASPRPIDDPKYFDENGEFSWVRISDVTASKIYLNKTEQKLSVLGASLSVKQYCGDLFLSIAGTVGKPIIAGIKCCIHDGFVSFSNLSNRVNKMFLFYILDSGNAYSGLGKEGSQLNLNIDTVANISIPLPPLETQTRIANYLDKKTSQIDTAIKKIEQEIELVQEYKKSLIYHATTGKIYISKNQTQPIQTKPSQTQPSQTQPN